MPQTSAEMPQAVAYHSDVIETAKTFEADRYLAALLAPEPHRSALLALAAFSGDLRRIPALVTEPMMGEVRLQWWRDTLNASPDGGPSGHPVADAMRAATRTYALPMPMLIAMTEARAFDLYADPMPDAASFDGYLAKTEALPFALAVRILTPHDAAPAPAHLADQAGRIYGTMRVLRDLPHWLARGRLPLPRDALAEAGVELDDVMHGRVTAALRAFIRQQATDLKATHDALKPQIKQLPPLQRCAFLPLATVAPYLTAITQEQNDPLRSLTEIHPLGRIGRIAVARWIGL